MPNGSVTIASRIAVNRSARALKYGVGFFRRRTVGVIVHRAHVGHLGHLSALPLSSNARVFGCRNDATRPWESLACI
jgi:hypothetical protein